MGNFQELLETLLKVVILPAIPIIATFIVNSLRAWVEKQKVEIENATIKGYLEDINDLICQAVTFTTQTYVDSLKDGGAFDKEAQDIAYMKTKEMVLALLTQDARDFITRMYGDIDLWLETKIEQKVYEVKYP